MTTSDERGSSAVSSKTSRWGLKSLQEPPKADSAHEPVMPLPTLSKVQGTPDGSDLQISHDGAHGGRWPMKAKVRKYRAKGADDDAEEDEEIGVHMWENSGKLVTKVPWFQREGRA